MGIGKKLEALLKEKKKRPGTLAGEIGIPKGTIYAIIKRDSQQVSFAVLQKIASALDVPTDYFLDGTAQEAEQWTVKEIRVLGAYRRADPVYQDIALELLETHPAEKSGTLVG